MNREYNVSEHRNCTISGDRRIIALNSKFLRFEPYFVRFTVASTLKKLQKRFYIREECIEHNSARLRSLWKEVFAIINTVTIINPVTGIVRLFCENTRGARKKLARMQSMRLCMLFLKLTLSCANHDVCDDVLLILKSSFLAYPWLHQLSAGGVGAGCPWLTRSVGAEPDLDIWCLLVQRSAEALSSQHV